MAKKTRKRTAKTAPVQTKVATATPVTEDGVLTGLYEVRYSDSRDVHVECNDADLRRLEKRRGYKVEKATITLRVYTS
jgi:hypothetical protein